MQIISMIQATSLVNKRSFSQWITKGLIGILIITIFFTGNVKADSGDLDESFSFDGKVNTGFGIGSVDFATGLAIQTGGKIVVAGTSDADGSDDFALARYNADGTLDNGFGTAGLVLTDFSGSGSIDDANALAIQSDGKIILAGTSNAGGSNDFALARYNADGSLDDGFGSGDIVLTDFSGGSFDRVSALAIQSDGKIVAAGISGADEITDFALARYNADGSLDDGFGSAGLVLTDFGAGSFDSALALTIQSDGKIVAAGLSFAGGSFDFALARYNADGSLDDGFGSGGLVLTDLTVSGSVDQADALTVQSDGKIVAAGRSDTSGDTDFALGRYNADGSLDNGFGSGGIVLTDFSNGSSEVANALAIQSDGKIVAVGRSNAGGNNDFALARYIAEGSLDNGFGSGGIVLTDFSNGSSEVAKALAIQSDGRIVAAGSSVASGNEDFALARYVDSVPAPTPSPTPMPGLEPGDANGDGEINILDVTAILNDILEISAAPGNGDCNEDGVVNILDVTCVLNIILEG